MRKRNKIIFGLVSILLIGIITNYAADSFMHLGLFSHNSIEVTTEAPLNINKVKILKGNWTINRTSDAILFKDSDYEVVFNNGHSSSINSDYGENDFIVIYDDKYYNQFRHFIFNRRHFHDYRFNIIKVRGEIKLLVNINGLDGMKFERTMNPISMAPEMITNVPKEKAGTIYNMKELETK